MSPQRGAETSIYLASDPRLEGVTGKYFTNKKETESSAESHDVEEARRLWDASCQLLGMQGSGPS
jgi:hypothetical protein